MAEIRTASDGLGGIQAVRVARTGNCRIGLVSGGSFQGQQLRGTGRRPPEEPVYDIFEVL